MAEPSTTQNFANHTRFDPSFHGILLPIFLINVFVVCFRTVRNPGLWNFWLIVVSIGALLAILKIRQYGAKVQDRVIRLEERLRLASLAPGLQVQDLTERQLVGLRFASDEEVAVLARRALQERMSSKEIKMAIQTWRPDWFRV